VAARENGAASSPTKYGLNGTMPATVNSTVGSWGIRLAESTATCWRSVKKFVNARRSSFAVVGTDDEPEDDVLAEGEEDGDIVPEC